MSLSTLTIAQAHAKLASQEITAQELVRSCIERIESIDSSLNCVVHKNFDRALEEAKKIDLSHDFSHPLTGIPYFVKDNYCETGVPSTACSNILRNPDYVPPFDATTIARLKAKGAISLGKTNTDEFTMGASTETSCFGPTHNPWNPLCVAGGSSGGSAAGVSADECLFALGTDTGGSIRQPAGLCSCTGLRGTYGRTSRYGVMSMASSLDTIGPLAKTVEDIAIILETIAGRDPYDATTSDRPVPRYSQTLKNGIKGMTVGLPKEYFTDGLDPDTEASVRTAAKTLQGMGATLKDISLPHTSYAAAPYYVLCPCEVSSNMARYDGIRFGHTVKDPSDLIDYYERVRSEGFGDEVKRRIMLGTFALSAGYYDAYYRQAQKVRTLIKQDFDRAFAQVDAIISPVSPTPAFEIGAHAGDPVAMYLEDIFMCAQPLAGIPALSIPCGFTKAKPSPEAPQGAKGDGNLPLPIGLQIMGPQWQEERLLQISYAYEQATDWHSRKPPL